MSEIKEQYINKLKKELLEKSSSSINDYEIISEDYFEWEIDNFGEFIKNYDEISSPDFSLCGQEWVVQIYSYNDSFTLYLKNKKIKNDNERICIKAVFSFCNYKDTSKFKAITSSLYSFNNTNNCNHSGYKLEISEKEYEDYINPLVEDDKIKVGVFLCVYNNDKLEKYIDEIKDLIKLEDNYYENKGENYYEWAIENWNEIESFSSVSPNFLIGGIEWKLTIYPNEDGYVKFELKNLKCFKLKDDKNYFVNYVFTVRHCDDLSCYCVKSSKNFKRINKKNDKITDDKFIKTEDLLKVNKEFNKPFIQNNKIIVGLYLRVCDEKEQKASEKIKSLIINDDSYRISKEKYYEWRIDDWNEFKNGWYYSPDFSCGKNEWYIRLCPDYNGFVHLKLEIHYSFNYKEKEHVYANCVLFIRNINDASIIKAKASSSIKHIDYHHWSIDFPKFMKTEDLYKDKESNKSLMINNKVIVGAYLCIYDTDIEIQ
ncbi:hypothetical protein BCR36DRAFT_582592 [Piromyces finnis]|uniref:MATH domain-containing protein n=1 Tax=Piromyces finnis TaxID=1754191 RepID=A0A1Y1VBD9_9FUNG|nr:hypothetical protein BCR36DRAFT_582592 [Piromyces finnis]|eukprot:ORX52076.1 hypothetical protein BCR36DRAFT_582592 [Piromyces finnis]